LHGWKVESDGVLKGGGCFAAVSALVSWPLGTSTTATLEDAPVSWMGVRLGDHPAPEEISEGPGANPAFRGSVFQVIVYGIEPSNTPAADHHTRLSLAGHVGASPARTATLRARPCPWVEARVRTDHAGLEQGLARKAPVFPGCLAAGCG